MTDSVACTHCKYSLFKFNFKFILREVYMNRVTDFLLVIRVISESRENLSQTNNCLKALFAQY